MLFSVDVASGFVIEGTVDIVLAFFLAVRVVAVVTGVGVAMLVFGVGTGGLGVAVCGVVDSSTTSEG